MNNACPEYLSDLLPPVALTTNPYHRRRPYERIVPPFRTELYRNSFFPSTTLLYFLASSSISEVRCCLTMNNGKVPSYYYSGKRIGQIIHCRLHRDLNFDLVTGHHTDNPLCACCHSFETAKRFWLFCPNYQTGRKNTIMNLQDDYLNTDTLLIGNQSFASHANDSIL